MCRSWIRDSGRDSFSVDSIGKLTGLAPENPLLAKISKAYFLWQRTMPFID